MLNFKNIGKINICLIGLMGCGKSVIGRDLAKYYKINFYDSDLEIEKDTGKKISEIFLNYGEKYFRELEKKICLKLLNTKNCIISLGGGSIIDHDIRAIIQKNSYSIYLKVDINILVNRLKKSDKRPLLLNVDKEKKLKELYKIRKKFYNAANKIIENNSDKNEVSSEIKKELKPYEKNNNF